MVKDDLCGQIFGRLTVQSFVGYPKPGKAQWSCSCACGNPEPKLVYGYNLKNGNTQGCGCVKIEKTKIANSTHGKSKTPLYAVYRNMLVRCYLKTAQNYSFYGQRGIKVSDRWRGEHGFLNFIKDMGPRPKGRSIERKNNAADYGPNNCFWATSKTQNRNKRSNRIVKFDGRSAPLVVFCEQLRVPYKRVHARLSYGWSVAEALTAPARR